MTNDTPSNQTNQPLNGVKSFFEVWSNILAKQKVLTGILNARNKQKQLTLGIQHREEVNPPQSSSIYGSKIDSTQFTRTRNGRCWGGLAGLSWNGKEEQREVSIFSPLKIKNKSVKIEFCSI